MTSKRRRAVGKYLGDAVYGALDGSITTFAVVAGVAGASLSSGIILVLGIANLIADGISMAVGNYLAKRSEEDYRTNERDLERLQGSPAAHEAAVRELYRAKGFSGQVLEQIVSTLSKDRDLMAKELLANEGIAETHVSPIRAGLTTFAAFVLAGSVPLLAYVVALVFPAFLPYAFLAACTLTFIAIFAIGSMRSLLISRSWWRAGTEMLLVGGLAALAAFVIGYSLRGLA